MDLTALMMTKKQETNFRNKNINTVEELLRFFPLRYYDCSKITGILPKEELSCVIGTVTDIKKFDNKFHTIQATVRLEEETLIGVTWFHMPYLYNRIIELKKQKVLICGSFDFDNYKKIPCVINPFLFTNQIEAHMKLYPVYSNIQGVKSALVKAYIDNAMNVYPFQDYYSDEFIHRYGLMPMYQAFREQHHPTDKTKVAQASDRFMFDDMLYFTLLERQYSKEVLTHSQFIVRKRERVDSIVHNLPYQLTDDQKTVLEDILAHMSCGERVNGLLQGDVSCGKSIVCFLLAVAMAENGYQAAIMTPNKVLARQHYEDLSKLLENSGINIAFYADASKMRAKVKRSVLNGMETGEIQIVVGTTSLISDSIKYKNLGLAIVDEEHKFGVIQRQNLMEKGNKGVHTLIMSATPIPRTMAKTIYDDHTELYSIKKMPNGRKRIKSCVTNNASATILFLLDELKSGHQAYIVCPMIDKNEKVKRLKSADELYQLYQPYISTAGYTCAILTGKTGKVESAEIMEKFKNNEIQVLIATSVIEVGVNVPNATLIIIHNAEMFGLAGLHQLRGRVGRGADQSYCIFYSDDLNNERLDVISHTTDGFEIAEMDMKMRNPGDLIRGVRQSGKNKYIDMILVNKDRYEIVKRAADEIVLSGQMEHVLEKMESTFYHSSED